MIAPVLGPHIIWAMVVLVAVVLAWDMIRSWRRALELTHLPMLDEGEKLMKVLEQRLVEIETRLAQVDIRTRPAPKLR